MRVEKLGFVYDGLLDRAPLVDLELGATLDTEIAELEWIDGALEQLDRVSAGIHEVDLSDDSDRAVTVRINDLGKL